MQYVKKLSSEFVNKYKDKNTCWGPVGYITYKRTYARLIPNEGRTEEWFETVERCCNGILDIGGIFTLPEIERLYDYVFNLKICFSGRALWQLGTSNVSRIGADSLQNCWHVAVNSPVDPFCFTFNQLMLGGGVGFNITPEIVYELPKVKHGITIKRVNEHDVDFIVTDNREGWVKLLKKVLKAFFYTGRNFTYSTVCIRSKDTPIKGFGGVASGPEGLVKGITQIVNILNSRVNYKLRPIDCLDIMNIIGDIVVAGNVRRSAQLALGSPEDMEFLNAKNWSKHSIPNWRKMSNNSVSCTGIDELPETFWDGYEGNGEPYGFVNLDNCRKFGRISDGENYRPDHGVTGTNPCGEIPLEPYEACNLFELFLPNLHSVEEFLTAASLGYKVTKVISTCPFQDNKVNAVVGKNHRLGIGCSGLLQSSWLSNPDVFSTVYNSIEELDKCYSRELGVKESIKLTTVKPSGTLSLLAGVTPGIHPAYAQHYIRRIRFSSNDPLVDVCRANGYHIEPQIRFDGSRDLDTMVVSFPIKTPSGTILAEKVSAIDQLQFQSFMQNYWSDNAVSMTCYYKREELPAIKEYLKENYSEDIKTASFLLHEEHGFVQAPYEPITSEQYDELARNTKPVNRVVDCGEFSIDSVECSGGSCPIK